MGAYAPVPSLATERLMVDIIVKASSWKHDGPYAGLILTAWVTESRVQLSSFGDPEIILPRLTSDFAQNITDILDGKEPAITWRLGVTLGVVVAQTATHSLMRKVASSQGRGDIITYYAGKICWNGQDLLKWWRVQHAITTADTVKDGQISSINQLWQTNTEGPLPKRYSAPINKTWKPFDCLLKYTKNEPRLAVPSCHGRRYR